MLPKGQSPPIVWAAAYRTNIQDLHAFLSRREYALAFYIASPYIRELLEAKQTRPTKRNTPTKVTKREDKEKAKLKKKEYRIKEVFEVFQELLEFIQETYPDDTRIINDSYLVA